MKGIRRFLGDVFLKRHKEREKVFRQVTYFFIRIGILVGLAFALLYCVIWAIGDAMNLSDFFSIPTVTGVITAIISLIVCSCTLVQRRKEHKQDVDKLRIELERSKGKLYKEVILRERLIWLRGFRNKATKVISVFSKIAIAEGEENKKELIAELLSEITALILLLNPDWVDLKKDICRIREYCLRDNINKVDMINAVSVLEEVIQRKLDMERKRIYNEAKES